MGIHVRKMKTRHEVSSKVNDKVSRLGVHAGPALGLGQLGHCLGPLTREGPKFGGNFIYLFLYINIFGRY